MAGYIMRIMSSSPGILKVETTRSVIKAVIALLESGIEQSPQSGTDSATGCKPR